MPRMEHYTAEVVVTVRLRSQEEGVVAEYSVTRQRHGNSSTHKASVLIEGAEASAGSAARILGAGVDNAEARRLK